MFAFMVLTLSDCSFAHERRRANRPSGAAAARRGVRSLIDERLGASITPLSPAGPKAKMTPEPPPPDALRTR
jgi:hypothetical protein